MSDGLYKSYQDATGSEQVNKEIAQMVVEKVSHSLTLRRKTLIMFICLVFIDLFFYIKQQVIIHLLTFTQTHTYAEKSQSQIVSLCYTIYV